MRSWIRWQDWVALVAGGYAFLSPIWTASVGKATGTLIVLGLLTALIALGSLAAPGVVAAEYLTALLGVLFFISPWVIGFVTTTGMAWTAWVIGVVTFVAGLAAIPESQHAHRGRMLAQH
jgi:hypothetical protein